jgi:hypothetical protein
VPELPAKKPRKPRSRTVKKKATTLDKKNNHDAYLLGLMGDQNDGSNPNDVSDPEKPKNVA